MKKVVNVGDVSSGVYFVVAMSVAHEDHMC